MMSRVQTWGTALVTGALLLTTARPAAADDYFGADAPDEDIQFRMDKPRTKGAKVWLASLFGGAAVFGGIGLGFHLRSESKADSVSAVADHTRRVYDRSVDNDRKAAVRAGRVAIASYSVAGALAIAGVVTLYLTEPGTQIVTVGQEKQQQQPPPSVPVSRVWVAPVDGGALAGAGWSF